MQGPKVQKSNSENSPLRLAHQYRYAIHTKQYVINGCKLSFSNEKSQSPKVHQISHSGKFYFLWKFEINAKVQKSKSPTLKTAHTDWPTYTVIPYTLSSML